MSQIEGLIKSYSDQELAFLYTYNLGHYMNETQVLICDYIFEERKLTEVQLREIVTAVEASPYQTGCPRCRSNKWNAYDVHFEIPISQYNRGKFIQSEIERENDVNYFPKRTKIDCNVCGYIIEDPNMGWWMSIKRFFKIK